MVEYLIYACSMNPKAAADITDGELQRYGKTALKRQMHVPIFVIHACDVRKEDVVRNLAQQYETVASQGYQGVVVMTAPEELYGEQASTAKTELINNPLQYIYQRNGPVLEALKELATLMRVPLAYVFAVINYAEVNEQSDHIDELALMALDKALDIAEDRLNYERVSKWWRNHYHKEEEEEDGTRPTVAENDIFF